MSSTAPEARIPPPRTAAPAAGGNFLTRKFGPLPAWGWIALGAVGGGVFLFIRSRQAASSGNAAQTAADTTGTDTAGTDTTDVSGENAATIQSEVQQLQGAESTTSAEEAATATQEEATGKRLSQVQHNEVETQKKGNETARRVSKVQHRINTPAKGKAPAKRPAARAGPKRGTAEKPPRKK